MAYRYTLTLTILFSLLTFTTASAQPVPAPIPVAPETQSKTVEPAPAPAPVEPAPSEPRIQPAVVPTGPNRSGFTLELGAGPGFTLVAPDDFDSESEFGLSGLTIGMGGFINEDLAIQARISGTSYTNTGVFQGDIAFTQTVVNAVFAVTAQYFLSDAFYISGGPGLAIFSVSAGQGGPEIDPETGFALNTRVGYSFWDNPNHRLGVSVEVNPAIFGEFKTLSAGLNFEWQLL